MVETGVDMLFQLVREKHQVSAEEAAQKLGVDRELILTWALLLQEDKLIDMHYGFSSTLLVLHEKKETEPQPPDPGEAFIRKIDRAIEQLDTDTEGVGRIRQKFENMKRELGAELEEIQADIDVFHKYTGRQSIIDDAMREKKRMEEKKQSTQGAFARLQRRYDELLAEAEKAGHSFRTSAVDEASAKNLEQYIAEMRAKSSTDEQIASNLRQVGWQETVIAQFMKKEK